MHARSCPATPPYRPLAPATSPPHPLGPQVRLALQQLQHPRAASTAGRNANSVETPHNTMHVLCGFPMTSIDYAAFHPLFFLWVPALAVTALIRSVPVQS